MWKRSRASTARGAASGVVVRSVSARTDGGEALASLLWFAGYLLTGNAKGLVTVEVQSVSELTESWVNGNRQDVADYLSAAHPAAAAALAVYWFNHSDALWADYRNILIRMLVTREFAAGVSRD